MNRGVLWKLLSIASLAAAGCVSRSVAVNGTTNVIYVLKGTTLYQCTDDSGALKCERKGTVP